MRPPLRRFFLSRLLCLGAALPTLAAVSAVLGAPSPNSYFYRSWRTDNGLPDNSVNAVLQDPRGYLWLATMTGLVRFDGSRFQEFPLPENMRSAGENIRALAQEDPDTLILLPASGGIYRFRAGQFSRHPAADALAGRQLLQLFVEPDGALWLGDGAGEVIRWKDGATTVFGAADGLVPNLVGCSVAMDGRGRTWVAEGDFLGWYENGRLVRFPQAFGSALSIAPSRSGGIWVAAAEKLYRWEGGRFIVAAADPAWPLYRSSVQRLFESRDGVLWIGTRRSGLFQFADGRVQPVSTNQQRISWVTEDSEDGVWVAAIGAGGVSRVSRKGFSMIYQGDGQADTASSAVCVDRRGAIWCADRTSGVVRIFGGQTEQVNPPAGENFAFYANSVCPDRNDHIWVGAASGLYRLDAGGPLTLERIIPALRDIHALYYSRAGDLWISSGYVRLGRIHQGVYEPVTAGEGYPGTFVTAMSETADGTIWIATEHQLFSFVGGRLVPQPAVNAFAGERLSTLYGDSAGALWIGTARGLLRLREGHLAVFTRAQGLPSERIEEVLEDDHDVLWIGSRQGYFHVARSDLEAVAEGRSPRVAAITFGAEEGLTGEAPVTNCQPNAWKGPTGQLLFCTQAGVIAMPARTTPASLPTPPIYIDRVIVDGRTADPADLRLRAGAHRLALYFSSPNFAAPEKVRLRYRLLGFDNGWSETSSDQETNYGGLPAGHYLLDVAASDPDGIWRDSRGATLPFVVVPVWWATWWARLLALIIFTSLIAWLARRASHRLLKRRLERVEQAHALEKERARIARDLHDELGGSLTQIGLLADRLRLRGEKSELEPGLGQLTHQARRLASELESIIWTVNPRNNSLDRLAAFIRQYSLRFFRDSGIACVVLGVEEIPALPITPEVQHHLLTATKEALNNALKHSRAASVTVDLRFEHGGFSAAVCDNGVGFNPGAAENAERNGLNNLRSRLDEVGGILDIRSSPGAGATIAWRVPLAVFPAASPSHP